MSRPVLIIRAMNIPDEAEREMLIESLRQWRQRESLDIGLLMLYGDLEPMTRGDLEALLTEMMDALKAGEK